MRNGKSRLLMSSSGDEPVADGGGDGHSVFARAFINGLKQADDEAFTAQELFSKYILQSVAGNSEQTPRYAPLRNSGHDNRDFVFERKRKQ